MEINGSPLVCRLFFSTRLAHTCHPHVDLFWCESSNHVLHEIKKNNPFDLFYFVDMNEEEQKLRTDTACKAAEEFTKLYFESFDLKRHVMNKFYMNDATFSWDGNPAIGKDAIQKFLDDLPQTTHTLTAVDAQPVFLEAVKGQQAVLVQVAGFVVFVKDKETKGFAQSFLITAQDNKWKIVNDSCRLQVPINSKPRS